jgi:predicted ATPase
MFLHSLRLTNVLSFGPDTEPFGLRPLNVLIGPNGSGKSNFVEAIALLRSAPGGLARTISEGGGIGEWIWKGRARGDAVLEAVFAYGPKKNLRHRIALREVGSRFEVVDERLENERPAQGKDRPFLYFGWERGRPTLNVRDGKGERALRRESLDPEQSILSQFRDPERYPELAFASETYASMALYRAWTFGRSSPSRLPERADAPNDRLLEDATNLGLILNRAKLEPGTRKSFVEAMRQVFDGFEDVLVKVEAGTVQVFVEEKQGWSIPATRLSDGTIRWLALVALLLDPNPPPVACIEEPELGLHPDMIPTLAKLLKEASSRMQLVVTTQSDVLVDAMSDSPEDVVVVSRDDGATTMRRLDASRLEAWLKQYRLGQLWSKGTLGGNRW